LNIVKEDLSFQLPFIKIPTIIIWGDKDEYTPPEDAYYMEKHIKNAKLIMISGADHHLHRKQPEVVAQDILNNI